MRDETDRLDAKVKRLLGESHAVSSRALRASPQSGIAADGGLSGRIARIRTTLAAIGEHRPLETTRSAAARLRLLVALSTWPGGERRLHPRWPLAKSGVLRIGSQEADVSLLDLGLGGALLAPVTGLPDGPALDALLSFGDGTAVAAKATTDATRLVHLAFADGAVADAPALSAELQDWAAHYEAGLWQVTALANEVERLFDSALADGIVAPGDLLGTGPGLAGSGAGMLAARLLALMARVLPPSDERRYVAATNRNGVTTCASDKAPSMIEHDLSAKPPMDAVTLRAARFSDKALVQTYRRRPGREPLGVVADLSAPVFVRGQHWGCVRIGRALPNAARV